jgi:hypothetical protein
MNRTQLEHIIRAASQISADKEIVVIGSQSIHALDIPLPDIAYLSQEADVYPRNHPDRTDDVDGAMGELSQFHVTHGYYAHGVAPETAVLPKGWEDRLVRLTGPNTGGTIGLCLDVHDLVLSKYAAGREKDLAFNAAVICYGCVTKKKLLSLLQAMPVDAASTNLIRSRITADFAAANPKRPSRRAAGMPKTPKP